MEWYYYLLVVYVIGLIISCVIVSKWESPVVEKIFAVVFWPLTAVLYGIHWIHNKL